MFEKINKIAGIVGSIGAIIATIIIFNLSQQKKELTFTILSTNKIVDLNKPMLEKLSISYDSFKVTQLYMIECKIENTGNKELTPDDFLDEINIEVDRVGKILTVNLELYPTNMSSEFGHKLYFMRLKPDLLNPNDYIKATLFYSCDTNTFNPPVINSRIKNGQINTIDNSQNGKGFKFNLPLGKTTETILYWVTLIMNLFYVFFILYASFKYNQDKPFYINIIVFIILSFSIIFSILYMIKDM